MKISVITVCKNSEKLIEQAIKSVVDQTYSDIEYIIIDGNSHDRTQEIINTYRHRISRFVSESDDGIYAAMNKGINLASGDFIYFLNSDDYLFDNHVIQDIANFLICHPDCDLVYGDIDARDLNHNYVYSIIPPQPGELMEKMIWGWIYHQATFSRRSLFDKFGKFDESLRISADHDWLYKILESNVKLLYYPRKIASYWLGGISAIPDKQATAIKEIFLVQNRVETYQQTEWLKKRLFKFQSVIIEFAMESAQNQQSVKKINNENDPDRAYQLLYEELIAAKNTIRSMETSKFWKLRGKWFKVKDVLRRWRSVIKY
jgi:glycosyltransferase involved in cell wall biosynthesis